MSNILWNMAKIRDAISPYLYHYVSSSDVLKLFGKFKENITYTTGDKIDRAIYTDKVLSVTTYEGSCSVENAVWDENEDNVFHVSIQCIEHDQGLLFCIGGVYIPISMRRTGVADKIFLAISTCMLLCGVTDGVVDMCDTSADYNDSIGISTHLCLKHGITPKDNLAYVLGLTTN